MGDGKLTCGKNCESLCGCSRLFPTTAQRLEEGVLNLLDKPSHSLLKKYLSRQVYLDIKNRKTKFGSCLMDCVQSGLEYLEESKIGLIACDAYAFQTYAPLFNPIIEVVHRPWKMKVNTHPLTDWGEPANLTNLDPTNQFVISIKFSCTRSVEGYPFQPVMLENHYSDFEELITAVFNQLSGDYKGTYLSWGAITPAESKQLIKDEIFFDKGNKFLEAAKVYKFWPLGRGIFYNEAKNFVVWVNEEEHLKFLTIVNDGDYQTAYRVFKNGINRIERKMNMWRSNRIGYLNSNIENLGTTLDVAVYMKLPILSKKKGQLDNIADRFNIKIQEEKRGKDVLFKASNRYRLGLTEYQTISDIHDAVSEIMFVENPPPE